MPVALVNAATTPHHRPKRNLAAKSFWKKTWPGLKDQGWDYDGKRFFYPPDGYRQYAQKRRSAGSELKEFFDGIAEVGEYVRQNPGIRYVQDPKGSPHEKVQPVKVDEAEEEHKASSPKDDDEKKKKLVSGDGDDSANALKIEANGGKKEVFRTPSSSPKEEPSAPTPKNDFRLPDSASSRRTTVKKPKKTSIVKLRKIKPQKRKHSKSLDGGTKVYLCDRCGRNNFINGHALGGHKKYCSKPEYDKARERAQNRAQRMTDGMPRRNKRKRSSSDPSSRQTIGTGDNKMMVAESNSVSRTSSSSSEFNLQGITNTIRDFADRVDDLGDLELDEALNTSDLFELQVIQTVLREERARLSGRLAGLEAAETHPPMLDPLDDIFNDIPSIQEQKSGEIDDDYEMELVGTDMAMSLGF